MLKNYIKTAIRQLLKNKFYSVINILGLAIGLTSCLYIYFYVQDELSYDQFHVNKEHIYRISEEFKTGDGVMETGLTPAVLAHDLERQFPEIVSACRMDYDFQQLQVKYGDKKFMEEHISAADSNFFSFFSFPLLSGDPATALNDPNTVVIDETIAHKYFPGENPVGKMLEFIQPYNQNTFTVKVTGVYKNMPSNSHFHYNILLSAPTTEKLLPQRKDILGWTSHFAYLQLAPQANAAKLQKAINDFIFKNYPKNATNFWSKFNLLPMTDIHLRSHLKEEAEANGDIKYVYLFSAIALFIILLAAINYMNLATARAANRAREVGVRKVAGAEKKQLVMQFLTESVIITLLALIIAGCLTKILQPYFNNITGKSLSLDYFQPNVLLPVVGITFLIGLVSGSYPAFFLSAFQPAKVLKGALSKTGSRTVLLRRSLVVLQFSISTILIIGTIVIYRQWHYMRDQKLGIDSDQVIMVQSNTQQLQQQYQTLKTELLRNASITKVTGTRKNLTTRFSNYTNVSRPGDEEVKTIPWSTVDPNFFKTFDIPIIAGSNFRDPLPEDTVRDFIVNEAAARELNYPQIIGTEIQTLGLKGRIVGIARDFHFESLHQPINPCIFVPTYNGLENLAVKVKGRELAKTVEVIKKQVAAIDPNATFSYSFLDDDINNLYQSEATFLTVFTTFASLAIIIACLGIFGLVSFTATQRTKEIGIRKVLGASVESISFLLTKEFIKLVLVATLIAWPVAWYGMHRWLQDFPYRTNIAVWMFVIASIITLFIAIVTVGFQAIRAALMNPVKSLRTE